MTAYYNEIDPAAAHVLRAQIDAGVIAPGIVDTRSIKDVSPDDLKGFTQVHLFAGGGLWSVAARLAGWPDERPLWTGSCPCQPHSGAASNRKRGFDDERDLWPYWFKLIWHVRPECVAGEQVDDSVAWIDRMHADLESAGYAVGSVDLPACAVDAAQERMCNFFVAISNSSGLGEPSRAITMATAAELDGAQCAGSGARIPRHIAAGELGVKRRVEPGIRILADDVPGRVALLRIGGNAIVPQIAAEVLASLMDVLSEWRQ